MGKYKKENGVTKVGKFLKDKAPHILDMVGEVLPEQGALGMVKNLIKLDTKLTKEEKAEALDLIKLDLEAFKEEVEDRKSARQLYATDSIIQKIFSLVFLIGYGFLCWYMLEILTGKAKESELFKTMVTMIFTHTSTKLSTIIDFLFGGSMAK